MTFGKAQRIEGGVQLLANDGTPIGGPTGEPIQTPPVDPGVSANPPAAQPPASPPPVDPGVSANPPASAANNPPKPPGGEPPKSEPPKGTQTMAKPKNQKRNQPPGKKPVSEEAVLSRARRMFRKEMKVVAQALGMEEYDEDKLREALGEMKKAREDNQSALQRSDGRIKGVEEQNGELRGTVSQLQRELTAARRDLKMAVQEIDDSSVVHEIEKAAGSVGFRDTDYGVELFRRHARGLPDGQDPDVSKFFEDLKKDQSKRYLFTEEDVTAGPKPGAQTVPQQPQQPQQPPGQQGAPQGPNNVPDQGAPRPADPGGQPQATDALSMNSREFSQHSQDKYGYRPGA